MRLAFTIPALAFLTVGILWYGDLFAMPIPTPDVAQSTPLSASSSPSELTSMRPPAPHRTPPTRQKEYRNDFYLFSLFVPEGMIVEEFQETGTRLTVVFTDEEAGNEFQVYVQPYGLSEITEKLFKADMPSGVMDDPQEIKIDGVTATAFTGFVAGFGDTHEVWFVKNGFLYEVTAPAALDAWLSEIMKSWMFYPWPTTQ